jgi:SAM-dependent methyltransferase
MIAVSELEAYLAECGLRADAGGTHMNSGPVARPLSPAPIMEMATAFQRSRTLLTAFELELFTALESEARTSDEVSATLGTEPRATDRLMNALTALELLEKRDGRFRNSPVAGKYLVKGRPDYLGGLGHTNHLWATWSRLTPVVRVGHAEGIGETHQRDDEWLRPFIAAMHARARQSAGQVVAMLDLDGVSRVLDVGGGSGAYAMAFARARRGISAVVFDLPKVVPLTRMYVAQDGLTAEVSTVTGNYLEDPLGEGFDLVFMSAVIHSNHANANRLLVRKAAQALGPGGQLVVQDFLMNEDRGGPLQPALFALNMLVGTPAGDTFTESEVREWMVEAGFHDVVRVDTPVGTNLVIGRL